MATTPDLKEPQILAARAQSWQQTSEPLLTLEAARSWLEGFGLVLFAPRGGSLGAPAPSLVEATLGEARASVTAAESETARGLAARLVGEGAALPLNLLGGPGDMPDFLVSTYAFPFVFTLRGDKGWKRPPETTGAVKVTPLGLHVYELLAERGAMTVAEIVSEAGREVNESAVTRALSELWQLLRVLPVLQQGAGETMWELTTTRFLKAVKAGANAGQPTALSALVSLYLSQALVASEEEVAAFLSPLTARSRVRDVLHGLVAGRQLVEGVVQGKTVLYVPDSLPDLEAFGTKPETMEDGEAEEMASTAEGESESAAPGQDAGETTERPRIRRFEGGAGPAGRDLRGKPVRRTGGPSGPPQRREGFGARPERAGGFSRGPRREGESSGGDRRPFGAPPPRREPVQGGSEGAPRPRFDRPWREASGDRPFRPRPEGGGDRPYHPRPEGGGDRPYRPRPEGGGERPYRPRPEGGGERPFRPRPEGGGDRPYRPRPEGGGDRPYRPRPEGGGDRPYRPRPEGGGDRPYRPRPEDGGDRPYRPRPEGGGDRPYHPRPEGGGDRPYRPRPEGGGDRPFRPRPEGGSDRPYRPRPEGGGDRPYRPRPEGGGDRPYRPRPEGGGDRPFRPRPAGDGPSRPGGGGGFSGPRAGDRPGFKAPGFKGPGFKFSGFKRPGGKPGSGPNRADRGDGPAGPPRGPRPEDKE